MFVNISNRCLQIKAVRKLMLANNKALDVSLKLVTQKLFILQYKPV